MWTSARGRLRQPRTGPILFSRRRPRRPLFSCPCPPSRLASVLLLVVCGLALVMQLRALCSLEFNKMIVASSWSSAPSYSAHDKSSAGAGKRRAEEMAAAAWDLPAIFRGCVLPAGETASSTSSERRQGGGGDDDVPRCVVFRPGRFFDRGMPGHRFVGELNSTAAWNLLPRYDHLRWTCGGGERGGRFSESGSGGDGWRGGGMTKFEAWRRKKAGYSAREREKVREGGRDAGRDAGGGGGDSDDLDDVDYEGFDDDDNEEYDEYDDDEYDDDDDEYDDDDDEYDGDEDETYGSEDGDAPTTHPRQRRLDARSTDDEDERLRVKSILDRRRRRQGWGGRNKDRGPTVAADWRTRRKAGAKAEAEEVRLKNQVKMKRGRMHPAPQGRQRRQQRPPPNLKRNDAAALTFLNIPKAASTAVQNAFTSAAATTGGAERSPNGNSMCVPRHYTFLGCCHTPQPLSAERLPHFLREKMYRRELFASSSSHSSTATATNRPSLLGGGGDVSQRQHLMFTVVRDPVSRFVSSVAQVLGMPRSARVSGRTLQKRCRLMTVGAGLWDGGGDGNGDGDPGEDPDGRGAKMRNLRRSILNCTISFLKEDEHGYGLDADVHLTPSSTRLATYVLPDSPDAAVVVYPIQEVDGIMSALRYSGGVGSPKGPPKGPRRKRRRQREKGEVEEEKKQPAPSEATNIVGGKEDKAQSKWEHLPWKLREALGRLSTADMDDNMVREVCELYAVDVALLRYLGFGAPLCDKVKGSG